MIDILYGMGLVSAIFIGYFAWKYNWKLADIL